MRTGGLPALRRVASEARARGGAEHKRHERRIPALAVTAFARLEDRQRALAASFDDHLPKPVDPDRFLATVASLARPAAKTLRGAGRQ